MLIPLRPDDEEGRLAALHRYQVLDTPREHAFDDFTELASLVCDVPIALISLVDRDRQWFKSSVGLDATETSRDISFCGHAILTPNEYFEVADAREDERYADNPLVTGAPNIRFYAAAPLVTPSGHAVGTLCVIDKVPRQLEDRQKRALHALARQVVSHFELRVVAREEHDRCERLVAERTAILAESERFARATVDALTTALAILDADGKILAINRGWRECGGEDEGTSYFEALERDGSAPARAIAEGIRDVIAGRRPSARQERSVIVAGAERWCTVIVTRFAGDGPTRVVVALEDVTDRHAAAREEERLQEQLRHAQKLDALGTLAGGVAHDFNNILAAIAGNAEVGLGESDQWNGSRSLFEEILEACERGTDVARGVLTFSRHAEPKRTKVALDKVVGEAIRLLRALSPSNVDIRPSLDPATPNVYADPSQIHQVVINLVTNAFQALDGSPGWVEVHVAAHRGTVDGKPHNGCRLRVADSGGGIAAAVAPRIFEPFFTTKAVGGGTGLGLSIVHGIVRAHGGTVALETTSPDGAVFDVFLPAMPAEADAKTTSPPKAGRGDGRHVLLIDDEPALVRVLTRLLEQRGFRVTSHYRAETAVEAFERAPQSFDIAVVDYNLPGRTGLQLTRELLERNPALPIIVVSGFLPPATVDALVAAGVRHVAHKPVPTAELVRLLDDV